MHAFISFCQAPDDIRSVGKTPKIVMGRRRGEVELVKIMVLGNGRKKKKKKVFLLMTTEGALQTPNSLSCASLHNCTCDGRYFVILMTGGKRGLRQDVRDRKPGFSQT